MIRTALDSDVAADLTSNVDFLLVYSDLVTDPTGFERAHPTQQVVFIDRGMGDPGNKASIIDVERGAYTVAQIPAWYDAKAKARVPFLTIYHDRSNTTGVTAALAGRHAYRWVATLDGTLHIAGFNPMRQPDLVQVLPSAALGIHADLSLVLCETWRPTPPPAQIARALADLQESSRLSAQSLVLLTGAEQVLRTAS